MDTDTTVTLDQVHDGILAAVRAKFPTLQTVEAYPQDRKAVQLPAFLLELSELEPADMDPGTEQLAVNARFEALLIMPFRQPGLNPKLEIRKLAGALAAFVRLQRWGCPIGPARFLAAVPDDFTPDLDQYEVWRVEWENVIHLGETVWKPEVRPTTIMLGQVPEIGPDHVDDYVQIYPVPDGGVVLP